MSVLGHGWRLIDPPAQMVPRQKDADDPDLGMLLWPRFPSSTRDKEGSCEAQEGNRTRWWSCRVSQLHGQTAVPRPSSWLCPERRESELARVAGLEGWCLGLTVADHTRCARGIMHAPMVHC